MIVGRRVRFRRPDPEGQDHRLIVAWRNDPEIKRFFFEEEPLSLDSHLAWYERISKDPTQRYYVVDALMSPDRSDTPLEAPVPIGTIGLNHIDWRNRSAEYARLLIGPTDYRRGGYGREMEYLLVDYAFGHLNLHRLWAEVLSDNEAPLRLHHWAGFVEEGVLREHVYKQGRYLDVVRTGLLAPEFAVRRDELRRELRLA